MGVGGRYDARLCLQSQFLGLRCRCCCDLHASRVVESLVFRCPAVVRVAVLAVWVLALDEWNDGNEDMRVIILLFVFLYSDSFWAVGLFVSVCGREGVGVSLYCLTEFIEKRLLLVVFCLYSFALRAFFWGGWGGVVTLFFLWREDCYLAGSLYTRMSTRVTV